MTEAVALVDFAESATDKVGAEYSSSLKDQHIAPRLRIGVKSVIDHLRSALDYSAHAIYEVAGDGKPRKIYFPIARPGTAADAFPDVANRKIPGVRHHKEILGVLADAQAFSDERNDWLPRLATLSNENKHQNLTPQKRISTPRTTVRTQGATVSWGPETTFGAGVSIGGVPVDPSTQLPIPHPSQQVTRELWVDFQFSETGESVLPFLHRSVAGARKILASLEEVL